MGGKGSGNPGQPKTWKVGRKRGYWRGTIGHEARTALSIMGLQDAVIQRTEQHAAEATLIARLILAERDRLLRGPCPSCGSFEHFDGDECGACGWIVRHETDGLSDDEYDDRREGNDNSHI